MKQYFDVIAVSSGPIQTLSLVGKQEEVECYKVDMTRTVSPLKDIKSLFEFYFLCLKLKPFMVHSHTPKAGVVAMLAAKLARVPVRLHTVAGLPLIESHGLKRKVLEFVEVLTYSCATRVYSNSKGLLDFILQNDFVKPDKIRLIANGSSNGIDVLSFNPDVVNPFEVSALQSRFNLSSDDFVFVYVGRLVGDKGINELVAAFESVERKMGTEMYEKQVKLFLVGSYESDLDPLDEDTLHKIEVNPNIIAVGFQKDVRPYFAVSNVLVFPSYREGFPNVVMQAGSMGLPSIVSDINGCNEIIINNENGLLVNSKCVDSLAEKMTLIVNDPVLHDMLKSKARPMIENRYRQEIVWDYWLNEYKELMVG
jgi:glycosyltransferase involved in cell wall biosynthesis